MYSFKSRIRFSEVNSELSATLPSILSYFQDCSIFHAESIGSGIEYSKKRGFAWILSSWLVDVSRYPKLEEKVTVSTWAHGYRGFYGYRNFKMEDETGEILACANTNWIFTDLRTGHPTRIFQEVIDAYRQEPPLDMEDAPRKIPIPGNGTPGDPIPVRKYFIDSNLHVNNEKYILIAEEFLPAGFRTRQLRAEYKRAAVFGDTLYPVVSPEEDRVTVVLNSETGSPYAVAEFRQ